MPASPLPAPTDLERTCRALAILDALLCPEWDLRYFSFDAGWDRATGQRMASMRSGGGDGWFLVFDPAGVFLAAHVADTPRVDVAALYDGLPPALAPQRAEPAFSIPDVAFGGWHDGVAWTVRGDSSPLAEELALLAGDPAAYLAYAKTCFEATPALDAVARVLRGEPLTDALADAIAPGRRLADLADERAELGLPA